MAAAEPGTGDGANVGDHLGPGTQRNAGCDNVGSHWSRHLKCHVCYGYIKQPHTLNCGHSFCRICLVRLAQTTRDANPEISLRYLCLPCPTCRALFPASSILRGRASTSFLIQNLVCEWKKERKRDTLGATRQAYNSNIGSMQMQSISTVTLRSICTQTTHRTHRLRRRKSPTTADQDMHEEFHKCLRFDDFYFRSMTANSSDSSEDMDTKTSQPAESHPAPSTNVSETSTASTASSGGGPRFMFGHGFQEIGHQLADGHRTDWSPGRVLLMSVWCVYSMVVVGIAQPMLPYMVLITLFFLLLILK